MNYELAILAGRLSLVLVVFAPGYYLIRTAFVHLQRRGLEPAIANRLRLGVNYARISHPYLASLLGVTPLYHIFVMWQTHDFGIKVALGTATAIAVFFMLATGWRLKKRPADIGVRHLHRRGFFLLAVLLAAHRLV